MIVKGIISIRPCNSEELSDFMTQVSYTEMIKSNLLFSVIFPPRLLEHLCIFVKYVYIDVQTLQLGGCSWVKRCAHFYEELLLSPIEYLTTSKINPVSFYPNTKMMTKKLCATSILSYFSFHKYDHDHRQALLSQIR